MQVATLDNMKSYILDYSTAADFAALTRWHGTRITFLALFLVALFRAKTVNFAEAKAESNDKRMLQAERIRKRSFSKLRPRR